MTGPFARRKVAILAPQQKRGKIKRNHIGTNTLAPCNFGSDRFFASRRPGNIDRRSFLARASIAASAAVLLPAVHATRALAADVPIAETTSGKVRGVAIDGVNAFKGVP